MRYLSAIILLLLMESLVCAEICGIQVCNERFPIVETCDCPDFPKFCDTPITLCEMYPKQCDSCEQASDPFLFGLLGGFGGGVTFPVSYTDDPPIKPEDNHETIPSPEPLVLIPVIFAGFALRFFRKKSLTIVRSTL